MTETNPFRVNPHHRHFATAHLLSLFKYDHLPPHLQTISAQLCNVAHRLTNTLEDGPELSTGLRKLLEAKDCFVRQAVIDKDNVDRVLNG